MPEMPTLGAPPKQSPIIPIAITAVIVGCVMGGVYWLRSKPDSATPTPVTAEVPAASPDPQAVAPTPLPAGNTLSVTPTVAPTAPTVPVAPTGFHAFTVSIKGPLESAIVASEGKEVGTALTQVVNRSLVWWVRVPQDLVKGDTLSVVYETRENQEPLVHAVRFVSGKLGKTVEAYRFKATAEPFARFYQADLSELEERIVDGPLDSWDQITSLLRDGRRHKGVDFKCPVGTPVKATFDGVVVRKNWNFRGNGNSIELQEVGGKGRTALYLHLSEVPKTLEAGQKVKRGEVLAKSGNTGHSFAPHLHYQLMIGEKVIDPFESHQTKRVSLPAGEAASFEKKKGELIALFPPDAVPPSFGSR